MAASKALIDGGSVLPGSFSVEKPVYCPEIERYITEGGWRNGFEAKVLAGDLVGSLELFRWGVEGSSAVAARALGGEALSELTGRVLQRPWPPDVETNLAQTARAFARLLKGEVVGAALLSTSTDVSEAGVSLRALLACLASSAPEEVIASWRGLPSRGGSPPSPLAVAAMALTALEVVRAHRRDPHAVGKLFRDDIEFDRVFLAARGCAFVAVGLLRARPEASGLSAESVDALVKRLGEAFSEGRRGTGLETGGAGDLRSPVSPPPARTRADDELRERRREWLKVKEWCGFTSESMDKLIAMTGLNEVKKTMLGVVTTILADREIKLPLDPLVPYSALFVGNPGTGKTTVAKLYCKILSELAPADGPGPVSGSKFVQVSGTDLADQGLALLKAKLDEIETEGGGLLMIDEAYAMDVKSSTGRNVMNHLVAEMTERLGRLVVVMTGYENEMNELIAVNEGLPSRFETRFVFDDFDNDELLLVLGQALAEENRRCASAGCPSEYRFEGSKPGDLGKYARIAAWRLGLGRGRRGFANARAVQNLFKKKIMARNAERYVAEARRLAVEGVAAKPPDKFLITRDDILGPRRQGSE